jgi:hypothetical protein
MRARPFERDIGDSRSGDLDANGGFAKVGFSRSRTTRRVMM